MNNRYIKIGLTGLVLAVAFSGLMWTTLRSGSEYYKHVDEVMVNPTAWEGKVMKVHGYVVPGSINRNMANKLQWRFRVENNGYAVNASYKGIPPDDFKDGSEVVLRGELTSAGFQVEPTSTGIQAKCPSKYEASKKVSYESLKKAS